jgi:glycosyltransferase involved in cell wall biosynthesis
MATSCRKDFCGVSISDDGEMKILVITPSYAYPPVKGYQVMLCRHIEQLATRHSIDLIAFGDSASGKVSGIDPIKDLCNSVEIILLPKWKIVFNLLRGLFSSQPLQVCLYRSNEMIVAIENRLKNSNYDAVICQLTRTVQFLPSWYRGVSILNMVDPLVLNYSRSLAWQPWYLYPAFKYEIERLRRYELRHAPRFDRVSLISQADVLDYQRILKNVNLEQIPYGIDTEYFQPDSSVERVSGMIVISGNMGYAPNVDGVKYFCSEIYPLILERIPNAHLWLVGARPSAEIKRLGKSKNITVTGYVDDVRYYLHRAIVSVCPIRLNVGTQTKVLEALATGTPVVTTTAGNQGVGGESGYHLYAADSPLEISNRIVSLLSSDGSVALSKSGRKFVQNNFQWEKSAVKLESIINELSTKAKVEK